MSDFINKIADKNSLLNQAALLRKKKYTPGFDGMTADKAYMWLGINVNSLSGELLKGEYEPMPVTGFYTAKRSGGYRRLTRTAAIDTVILNTVTDVLREKCENSFSDFSHAYRIEKGVTTALEQYCRFAEKHPFVAKIDPTSCFDNIDRDILGNAIDNFFADEALSELIMSFVQAPIFIDGVFEYPEKGIFQGSPISNMLCNIYFHPLDLYLEESGIPFVRYADDIVIFGNSLSQISESKKLVTLYLKEKLNLLLNEKKSAVGSALNMSFLGRRFEKNKGVVIAIENNLSDISAYNNWHETQPFNFHNTVDILSDGIISPKDYSLIFESDSETVDLPVKSIDTINIYSDVSFDGRFLNRAFDNNIIVNVFSKNNKLIGRFIPNTPLKSPKVTNGQIQSYFNQSERLMLAKTFVFASIHNTRLNIRYYNKQNPCELYQKALNKINNTESKIKICESYDELLLLEATVREAYYTCFDKFLKNEEFVFEKRTRKPPLNEVNAMISFGNTVLYNYLATAIYKSSLDIRVGFLHATNNRKESLNLDLAEIFKPLIVDRVVFSLINLRSINLSDFYTAENGGVYLNENGKRIFLRAFYEKLNTVVTIKESKYSYHRIIKNEVEQLSLYFKIGEKYKGFRQVR